MAKLPAVIRVRGARQNNLKNLDLDLPLGRLIVITGLSGSGKSSLAFDTLFAEGQRRYIETFSPYARQFFDRMDKPAVARIEGIPPAIAIEQRNAVRTTRSTVGTMTEVCERMKLLWPYLAQLHCRQCGRLVRPEPPREIWRAITSLSPAPAEVLVTFALPLSDKLPLAESLLLVARQGYQRLLVEGETVRVEEAADRLEGSKPTALTVVQDRVAIASAKRARFVEACEQAYHFGKGRLGIYPLEKDGHPGALQVFSARRHCATCDLEYQEPVAALFSFNHPLGACPACKGFGRIITIDYQRALPDRSKTLAGGAVKAWQTGMSAECQDDMMKFCRKLHVPTDVPFQDLEPRWQQWVMDGDPDYAKDAAHSWPNRWYGIKGYFRWLESKSYKMHVRVLLSRYRAYCLCPDCRGARLQPEALLYRLPGSEKHGSNSPAVSQEHRNSPHADGGASACPSELQRSGVPASRIPDVSASFRTAHERGSLSLADFYRLPLRDAQALIETLHAHRAIDPKDPLAVVLDDVRARLAYLTEAGLGYLTLDRPTRSLSGGETERVNLTTCLGTRLVNTLFVLDEPSVGLHPRDTERLVTILRRLRDAGNTVVVVEHETAVMRAADEIIDLGPGHGESGGEVVFQGPYRDILRDSASLTGQYLSGRKSIAPPPRRPVGKATPRLVLRHATIYNLSDLAVEFPLGRFVCITGVSGSGKSTLIRDVLLPLLTAQLGAETAVRKTGADDAGEQGEDEQNPEAMEAVPAALTGTEHLGRVVLVDQSPLGRTPRSNPAVYTGAFEDLRACFARTDAARQLGLKDSAFSFNSAQGQCERCRGAGFEKIEMQFLSDVFIRCPECQGRRYRPHILEVKLTGPEDRTWSIADMLEATVDEALIFLAAFPELAPAQRASASLKLLQEVGLGYLRLGQPVNTLSGGECQRLKLVRHLAESSAHAGDTTKPALFLFDEPTTGLHADDVRVLLKVFQRLVDTGHSVIVIEHNLDVVRSADWLIDLGPEAGDEGGKVVVCGPPETVAKCPASRTGAALKN